MGGDSGDSLSSPSGGARGGERGEGGGDDNNNNDRELDPSRDRAQTADSGGGGGSTGSMGSMGSMGEEEKHRRALYTLSASQRPGPRPRPVEGGASMEGHFREGGMLQNRAWCPGGAPDVLTEAAKKTKKVTKKKAMVREAKNEPAPEDEDGDPRGGDLRNRLTSLWPAGGESAEGLDTTQGSGMPMLPRSAIKSGRDVERELKQQAAEEERQVYTQELEMRYPTSESFLDGANYENQFVLGRLKNVRSRFDNRKWEAEFTLHEKRMRLMSRLHRTNHRTKGIRRKNNSSSSSSSSRRSRNTTTNLLLKSRAGGRSAGGATGGPLHILTDGQSVLQRVDPWEGAGSPQSPESPPHGRVTIFNADPHRKSKSRHMAVRIGAGGAGRSSGRGGGDRDRPALTSEVTALATMLTGVHMRNTLGDTRSGMSGDMGGTVKKTKSAKKKKKKTGGLQTGWRDGGEGVREGGGADGVGSGEEDVSDGVASAAAAAAAVPLLAAAGLYTRGS